MAGIPTTQADLTAQFPTTIGAGRFGAQQFQNLIASVPNFSSVANIKNFGAVGNGSSNPASTKYGSLAALQAVYGTTIGGVTVALTQELDWLAAVSAVGSLTHGTVIFPGSSSFVFCNSNSVSDGSGQIVFPTAVDGTTSVNLVGEPGTILNWPVDLGAGKFAIRGAGSNRTGRSYGIISNLTLQGPGCGFVLGATTSQMQGLGTSDSRQLQNIDVLGFKVGVNVVGGQCSHIDVRTYGCYYGYYWDNPDSSNFGNMLLIGVKCDNNLLAGIAVHHAASIISSYFLNLFSGTGPYSVYKETNGGSPTQPQIFHFCTLENFQFENFGNAAIGDDRAAGSKVATCFNTNFINGQYLWDDTSGQNHQIPATVKYCVFDIAQMTSCYFDGIVEPQQLLPGTVAIFNLQNGAANIWVKGDIGQIITNCSSGAASPHNGQMFNVGAADVRVEDVSGWTGEMYFDTVGTTVGEVIVRGGATSAGTTADVVQGIAMYAPGLFGLGLVAHSGLVTVKASGSVAATTYVRTAAAGAAVQASSWVDTTSVRIGRCQSADSGGFCGVWLEGLT